MTILIKNVRIVDGGIIAPGNILVENGAIAGIVPVETHINADRIIDGKGMYASAGFVDIHTHGAGGADFMDGSAESFKTACNVHLLHGTTTIIPTTLSASGEEIEQSIQAFNSIKDELNCMQTVPGLHLEGPYFSMEQRGGQNPKYVRNPDKSEYESIINQAGNAILRWSVAPELPGALEMGDYLAKHGILPAIGHSNAVYSDCVKAIEHGYKHVTHLYSCTSTITRRGGFRVLGVTESAYCLDALTVEIIADGCHLPPELIAMIVKCKGSERICLVTDSLRPTGLDVKEALSGSIKDGQQCIIEDGVAKMPDRTAFMGSIATADRLVRTAWKLAGVPLEKAIQMMCETPAKVMNLSNKGRLLPHYDADIVVFDEDVHLHSIIAKGKVVQLS